MFLKNSIRDSDADGVLLHELVHASRMMSGADESCTVEGGYGNSEEFYANTIKMIYRSETGLPVYDYKYCPFEPGRFSTGIWRACCSLSCEPSSSHSFSHWRKWMWASTR